MTLLEMCGKLFGCGSPYCEVRVTDEEVLLRENAEILFTLKGSMKPECYLNERFCKAEVKQIYAVDEDTFLILID